MFPAQNFRKNVGFFSDLVKWMDQSCLKCGFYRYGQGGLDDNDDLFTFHRLLFGGSSLFDRLHGLEFEDGAFRLSGKSLLSPGRRNFESLHKPQPPGPLIKFFKISGIPVLDMPALVPAFEILWRQSMIWNAS
jgi:hypothetical protein